jgi:hypothetical protein
MFLIITAAIVIVRLFFYPTQPSTMVPSPSSSDSLSDSNALMEDVTTDRIIVNPEVVEVSVGSKLIPLKIHQIERKNCSYKWELNGPGNFEGDLTQPVLFYKPPATIEGNEVGVIITVRIKNQTGQEIVESLLLKIVRPTTTSQLLPPQQIVLSIPDYSISADNIQKPAWIVYFMPPPISMEVPVNVPKPASNNTLRDNFV